MSALKIGEKTTAEMPVPAAQMPMAVPRREENQRSIDVYKRQSLERA